MTVIFFSPQTYQKPVLDRKWIIYECVLHAFCSVWHITINISGAQLANIHSLSRQQHESSLDKVCRDYSQELGTVLTKEIIPGSNLSLLKIIVLKSWAEGGKKTNENLKIIGFYSFQTQALNEPFLLWDHFFPVLQTYII